MFLWHEHVRAKVRYISTSLVLVFCIIWYICIIAGTEPQDSHACLSDTQMFVASICIVLACKSAAPKVLWYSNYCSQVCSVAAKATAFAHAFLFSILGFVARYLYFPNFGGVSVQTLGFTREVLVSQETCPQQTSRWSFFGSYPFGVAKSMKVNCRCKEKHI